MKLSYMQNTEEMMSLMSKKSLAYGDGKAWDNRKRKIAKRHRPRGKVWMRIYNQEIAKFWSERRELLNEMVKDTHKHACRGQ